jgi:hypothetical protein
MATADAMQLCSMFPLTLDAANAERQAQADAVKSTASTFARMLQPAASVTYTQSQLDFIVPSYAARSELNELSGDFSSIAVGPHS